MYRKLERVDAYEVKLTITEHAFDVYLDSSISVYYNKKNQNYYCGYCGYHGNDIFEIGSASDLNDFFLMLGGDDNE